MAGLELNIFADFEPIARVLNNLERAPDEMGDAFAEIGDVLADAVRRNIDNRVSPDGTPLAPLSETTKSMRNGDQPLRDRGNYYTSYTYIASDKDVVVGTNAIQAAVMHYGAKKGEFGRYSQVSRYRNYGEKDFRRYAGTKQGFPIPWGDIPPRRVLGVGDDDEIEIIDIVSDFLLGQAN